MQATFVELPAFLRVRADYLNDDAYRRLQNELMDNPEAGDVIKARAGYASFANPMR